MSSVGQFSSKNPTIKRILKEASELANQPSSDYHAAPLETDLFEWHFTLRGPPAPSHFEGGMYHGRIILPPAYPLKPPSFRFLTPSGRFDVNREICLSISGHHEETWQPAWGIRTALVAIRSFMDTDAKGQLGGMDASEEIRKRMAGQSKAWKCAACAKTNEATMLEQDELVKESGAEVKKEDVPQELRLAFRDDLAKGKEKSTEKSVPETSRPTVDQSTSTSQPDAPSSTVAGVSTSPSVSASTSVVPQTSPQPQTQQQQRIRQDEAVPSWIDKAIYGIIAALVILISKKWLL